MVVSWRQMDGAPAHLTQPFDITADFQTGNQLGIGFAISRLKRFDLNRFFSKLYYSPNKICKT